MAQQARSIELFRKCDFSPSSIAELQKADPKLQSFVEYLQDGTLPQSQKQSRKVLLEASDYLLVDGLLFHSRIAKSNRAKDLRHYQVVLPEVLYKEILKLYHDSPFAGHGGIADTLDKIKEHYYFPGMHKVITDYVKSCPHCQMRKVTKVHTKAGIVAYRTPSAPFQVWQADLYGPLPASKHGSTYIVTCVDMFSKYLFAAPLANKDALTVATALYQMFTLFGTCDTLIADRGSEFITNGTRKTLEMMGVAQDFIPSMVHHCLGACERTHRTLAERLTPYLENGLANWQDMLPSIVFAMNSSVNSSLGYSPHEIVFGERPKFPLSTPTRDIQLESLPRDLHSYVKDQAKRLETIRAIVRDKTLKSQQKMLDQENAKTHPVQVKPGDYVCLNQGSTGKGQKLQPQWTGPFVVDQVPSPHMILLKNPATGRCQRHPIHINRVKMAYVREPNPSPYFLDRVVTNEAGDRPSPDISEAISNRGASTVSDNSTVGNEPHGSSQPSRQPLRRSTRLRTRPSYYLDPIAPKCSLIKFGV